MIDKPRIDGVRIDPVREIAVNKLSALMGRNEPRDLVDLREILGRGASLETIFEGASWPRLSPKATLPQSSSSSVMSSSSDFAASQSPVNERWLRRKKCHLNMQLPPRQVTRLHPCLGPKPLLPKNSN